MSEVFAVLVSDVVEIGQVLQEQHEVVGRQVAVDLRQYLPVMKTKKQ